MSRVLLQCVLALACVATVSSPGAAQAATESHPSLGRAATAGPTVAGAAVGVRASSARPPASFETATESAAAAPRNRRGLTQSQVLMIVGGAALVSGILIGGPAGTLLVLGGAGIGGYGLYLYLQR